MTEARPLLALLPSPLLRPAVWRAVAEELSARGWQVIEMPAPTVAPRTPDDVLDRFLMRLPSDQELVLVAHSNARLYLPAIGERRRVVANVFVDAGLPDHSGAVPLAPEGLQDFLRSKADPDGLLPEWTHWWDPEDVTGMFPTAAVRDQVEREQQRLPLSYFGESLIASEGWDRTPGGYLAFGDTYAEDRDAAVRRGWPVRTMSGTHLHVLVEPERVTDALEHLLELLVT